MLSKRECPICSKSVSDFIQHISIKHNIKNEEGFNKKLEQVHRSVIKKEEFSNYVDQLKKAMREGEITAEKYRELITKWGKENRGT